MTSTRKPKLEFTPYAEQAEVLQSDARFRVVAAGRRSGKTIMAAVETVRRAVNGPQDWHGYWVGAEHRHADTAYTLVDKALPDALVKRRNQSPPRTIELVDEVGGTIEFHTAGGGALVSIGLDWAVCDEAGKSFPERSWTEELRPALSDRQGSAMFISTPGGRGWFYRRYERGQSEDYPEWKSWRWPTYRNPHVEDSEIDSAREELPQRIFEQEYLAEFVDETGGVFSGLDDHLFTSNYELPLDPDDAEPPFASGVDLARHEDYRVIVTIDSAGRIVYFDREQGEAWPHIQREVENVHGEYPGVVAIDASRDNKLVADLEASGIPIEPVKFSAQRKTELVENLMAAIENDEITAPEITQLRTELEVFEYDVTRAGNIRYEAPEGFHDDTVDALALAVDARTEAARQNVASTIRAGGGEEYGDSDGEAIREAVDHIQQQYHDTGSYGK